MALCRKAYVTVTKCAGIFRNERNAHTHTQGTHKAHTHIYLQGDDILSFGNHRLTQQGLVSVPRSFFQKKKKKSNMKTITAKKYELLIFHFQTTHLEISTQDIQLKGLLEQVK